MIDLAGLLGLSPEQANAYVTALRSIEGGNYGIMGGAGGRYAGAYQMGPEAIHDTAMRFGVPVPATEQFLADPGLQERFMRGYTAINHQRLMQNPHYAAMPPIEKLKVLGYAWNQGAGGASSFLNTGKVGRDGFGTPGTAYSDRIADLLGGGPISMAMGAGMEGGAGSGETPFGKVFSQLAQRVGGPGKASAEEAPAVEPPAGPFAAAGDAVQARRKTASRMPAPEPARTDVKPVGPFASAEGSAPRPEMEAGFMPRRSVGAPLGGGMRVRAG